MMHHFNKRFRLSLIPLIAVMEIGSSSAAPPLPEDSITNWLKQEPVSRWQYGLENLNAYLADTDQHKSLPEDLVYVVVVERGGLEQLAEGNYNDSIKIWARSADVDNLIDYEKFRCEKYIKQIKKDADVDAAKELNITSDYADFFSERFWDQTGTFGERPGYLKEVDQLFVVEVLLTDAYCTSRLLSDDIKHFSITGRPL